MRKLLAFLWFLNLWDAAATWYAVKIAGYGSEWNSTMSWALQQGAWVFFGLKVGVMTMLITALDRVRDPAAVFSVRLAVAAYVLVGLWHLYALVSW